MFASIFNMAVIHGRPIFDTMAAPMCHGLFARFPDLRIATIETGCHWVGHFLQEIGSVYGKRQEGFMEPPIETFRRQVWVSPFFEDNFNDLRDLIGADRILFGSDWPHAEGLDQPADYLKEIDDFDDAQKAAVLGGNARNLIGLPDCRTQVWSIIGVMEPDGTGSSEMVGDQPYHL